MQKIILFALLLHNFGDSSDIIENGKNIVKKNPQYELAKLVDLAKLKELDQKLSVFQKEIDMCQTDNSELKEEIKTLSKHGKTILKQIDLSTPNSSQLEMILNTNNPQSVQQIALKIYSQIVESKSPKELITILKNAQILDFDELLKEGPNAILNKLKDLLSEISEKKDLDLAGNINFVFSMWKTLAFNFDWNKIVKHKDCCCCKNEGNAMKKYTNNSIFTLRRSKRFWPNNNRFLCLCEEHQIRCSCKCFIGLILAELIVLATLIVLLWFFIVKWQQCHF